MLGTWCRLGDRSRATFPARHFGDHVALILGALEATTRMEPFLAKSRRSIPDVIVFSHAGVFTR
jgi:hypothetical protein